METDVPMHKCSRCGYPWKQGMVGDHDCFTYFKSTLKKSELLPKQGNTIKDAINRLKIAFEEDTDYAHTWFANLAMSTYDALPVVTADSGDQVDQVRISRDAASRFMRTLFGYKTPQKWMDI